MLDAPRLEQVCEKLPVGAGRHPIHGIVAAHAALAARLRRRAPLRLECRNPIAGRQDRVKVHPGDRCIVIFGATMDVKMLGCRNDEVVAAVQISTQSRNIRRP